MIKESFDNKELKNKLLEEQNYSLYDARNNFDDLVYAKYFGNILHVYNENTIASLSETLYVSGILEQNIKNMMRIITEDKNKGKSYILNNIFLKDFQIISGYVSPYVEYNNYLASLYSNFVNSYIQQVGIARTFYEKDFINLFLDFCKIYCDNKPVTLDGFLNSSHSSWLSTGASFAIKMPNGIQKDEKSFLDHIWNNHDDFQTYCNFLGGYGFRVDINNPWHIIADYSHPSFKAPKKLSDKYYHKARSVTLGKIHTPYGVSLSEVLSRFWVSFVNTFPETAVAQENGVILIKARKKENFITNNRKIVDKIYLYLRILESKVKLSERQFHNRVVKLLRASKSEIREELLEEYEKEINTLYRDAKFSTKPFSLTI